jgi:mannose-1-phosphate guanylyltransferase/phosphomannomutase
MKTVIMAGGFGTRLRPLTQNLPKPMVPMANRPMLNHIVDLLKKHSLTNFISLLYFQPEQIKDFFRDGSDYDVRMRYMLAESDLGTAGSVKNAESHFLGERVLVISGDVLTDFDLSAALEFHEARGAAATMILTRLENPLAYGVVITEPDGKITRFLEKPTWGEVFSDTINTGIYILEPEVFERIPRGEPFDFSQDLFPGMLEDGEKLYGYVASGYWRDVGNLSEYMKAHLDILSGKIDLWGSYQHLKHGDAEIWFNKNVKVHKSAKFEGTVILGDEVVIEPGATICNSVLGDRALVGANSTIDRTVIWHDTQIGETVNIFEAIICNHVLIEDNVAINADAVISEKVKIREGATIRANCKIWPAKEIETGAVVSSSLVWGEKWNRELFTDSKISGLGNIEITPEFAAKLGSAFAATLKKGDSLIVSRDVSGASRIVSRAFFTGVLSCGVNVVDLRTLPIPVIRYELKSGKHAGGIYVRHNPSNYEITDMIFMGPEGMDLSTRKSRQVELLFNREDFRRAAVSEVGLLDYPTRIMESYRHDLLAAVDTETIAERGFKLVFDFAHGGASEIFSGIFGHLKCDTITLNAYPDPSDTFRPGGADEIHVKQLATIVKSVGADLGVHLGRSAEKMVVVDREGTTIGDQQLLLAMTSLFLSTFQAKQIAVPVAASMGVEAIAEEYGVRVMRVRNDHLAMMQAFKSDDVDFVGGTRGGFIFDRFQLGADGMFAAVKLLELLAKQQLDLIDLRSLYEHYHRVVHIVPCPWARKGQVMRLLIENTEGKKRQLVDGVRVQENGGWVLAAPDRNEALFMVLAESTDKNKAAKLADTYRQHILDWQK